MVSHESKTSADDAVVSPSTAIGSPSKAPRYDMRLNPPYFIEYASLQTGRHFNQSKRRIRFRFGFSNAEALSSGATGVNCRGCEHDVALVWSHTSGKILILLDGREVYFHMGKRTKTKFQFSWSAFGNHTIKVTGHAASRILHAKAEGWRQFDLELDGQSIFDMPRIYELGVITGEDGDAYAKLSMAAMGRGRSIAPSDDERRSDGGGRVREQQQDDDRLAERRAVTTHKECALGEGGEVKCLSRSDNEGICNVESGRPPLPAVVRVSNRSYVGVSVGVVDQCSAGVAPNASFSMGGSEEQDLLLVFDSLSPIPSEVVASNVQRHDDAGDKTFGGGALADFTALSPLPISPAPELAMYQGKTPTSSSPAYDLSSTFPSLSNISPQRTCPHAGSTSSDIINISSDASSGNPVMSMYSPLFTELQKCDDFKPQDEEDDVVKRLVNLENICEDVTRIGRRKSVDCGDNAIVGTWGGELRMARWSTTHDDNEDDYDWGVGASLSLAGTFEERNFQTTSRRTMDPVRSRGMPPASVGSRAAHKSRPIGEISQQKQQQREISSISSSSSFSYSGEKGDSIDSNATKEAMKIWLRVSPEGATVAAAPAQALEPLQRRTEEGSGRKATLVLCGLPPSARRSHPSMFRSMPAVGTGTIDDRRFGVTVPSVASFA